MPQPQVPAFSLKLLPRRTLGAVLNKSSMSQLATSMDLSGSNINISAPLQGSKPSVGIKVINKSPVRLPPLLASKPNLQSDKNIIYTGRDDSNLRVSLSDVTIAVS